MSPARTLALKPLPQGFTVALATSVLAAVILVARSAAVLSPATPHPLLTTTAATLDLTVTASLLVWWVLGRDFGWSARTLVALFMGSMILAGVVLPAGKEGPLRAMHMAVAPLEIFLLAWLFRRVARARRRVRAQRAEGGHVDAQEAILAGVEDVVGTGRVAEILADEMTVLYYALARRPGRGAQTDVTGGAAGFPSADIASAAAPDAATPSCPTFTYHRRSAYGAAVFALILATLAEVPAMHLLLRLWSVRAAWIMSALGLYAVVWLIGDWRACLLRPLRLEDDTLRVRFGLRWRLDIPVAHIVDLRAPTAAEKATKGAIDLRLALPGGSWTVLELDQPVTAVGMYGRRRSVRTLGLGLDEPARLTALLSGTGTLGAATGTVATDSLNEGHA